MYRGYPGHDYYGIDDQGNENDNDNENDNALGRCTEDTLIIILMVRGDDYDNENDVDDDGFNCIIMQFGWERFEKSAVLNFRPGCAEDDDFCDDDADTDDDDDGLEEN